VNYSVSLLDVPEGDELEFESSGAPDSPVRQTRGAFGCSFALLLNSILGFFYWLSVNLLHLYNLYTRIN
jgi:hypothetical protein